MTATGPTKIAAMKTAANNAATAVAVGKSRAIEDGIFAPEPDRGAATRGLGRGPVPESLRSFGRERRTCVGRSVWELPVISRLVPPVGSRRGRPPEELGRFLSSVGSEPIEILPPRTGLATGGGADAGSTRRVEPVKFTRGRSVPALGVGEMVSSLAVTNFGNSPVGGSVQCGS